MKIYPSKRVKNHAAKKLRKIFSLSGQVVLKHAPSIFYDDDRCFGLCYSTEISEGEWLHRIILAEDANTDMQTYLSTLLHEYVHAWQAENDCPIGHDKKSKFVAWAKFLKETQKGIVI